MRPKTHRLTHHDWERQEIFVRPSTSKLNLLRLLTAVLAVLLPLFAASSHTQTDQGTITGVVQDSSGAVLPNAQVKITNVDTGLSLETKSNRSGAKIRWPYTISLTRTRRKFM